MPHIAAGDQRALAFQLAVAHVAVFAMVRARIHLFGAAGKTLLLLLERRARVIGYRHGRLLTVGIVG